MSLQEVFTAYPILGLIISSIVVTFISTIAHKYLTDQTHLKNQKSRQKELQKELKGCKDPKKLGELNSELLKITGTMFRSSMKPLLFTFIPFILIFLWLRNVYTPIMGSSWLWYYIGFSVVASIILRKVLDVA
jgi:uncharacterized membrane protein (DUF106 family)